jgi:hypothetical protein
MINRVNRLCNQEAAEKYLILPIYRADERTANCCGATGRQIRRERRERNEGSPLRTSGKKIPRKYERNVILDDSDLCVLKRTVIVFYVRKKVAPTCKNSFQLQEKKRIIIGRSSV